MFKQVLLLVVVVVMMVVALVKVAVVILLLLLLLMVVEVVGGGGGGQMVADVVVVVVVVEVKAKPKSDVGCLWANAYVTSKRTSGTNDVQCKLEQHAHVQSINSFDNYDSLLSLHH